jgi:hypothetical protein
MAPERGREVAVARIANGQGDGQQISVAIFKRFKRMPQPELRSVRVNRQTSGAAEHSAHVKHRRSYGVRDRRESLILCVRPVQVLVNVFDQIPVRAA